MGNTKKSRKRVVKGREQREFDKLFSGLDPTADIQSVGSSIEKKKEAAERVAEFIVPNEFVLKLPSGKEYKFGEPTLMTISLMRETIVKFVDNTFSELEILALEYAVVIATSTLSEPWKSKDELNQRIDEIYNVIVREVFTTEFVTEFVNLFLNYSNKFFKQDLEDTAAIKKKESKSNEPEDPFRKAS